MKYFDNNFLFSETYIKEYIKGNGKKDKSNDLLKNAFIQVQQWCNEYTNGDYKDDSWIEYIDAILDILGFKKYKNGQERLLYTNTITEDEKPVALCFSVARNIDISSINKGEYYAFNAVNAAKKNGVEWAILTNGYRWRIYNTKNISPYENYLEIDIESSINNNQEPNEAFELFYLFFNCSTYYIDGDDLIIEKIKGKSDKTAERIEDFLRGKSEKILTELCYGLKEDMKKDTYHEIDRKNIYKDAIILLYRMLFFGYAESRKMLPIIENDIDYTDSFFMLSQDAKEVLNNGELYKVLDGYEFWDRLDSQIRIYVDANYNGGLFNNEDKPILREHRIKNKYLIKCLAELSYNKDGNGKYKDEIEYKDLSVRNLGAIYEGMLEYQLFIAEERMVQRKSKGNVKYIRESETTLKNSDFDNLIEPGGIYLSQDATERKESGSFYTPEDVVEYIVDNTVGIKLREMNVQLQESLRKTFNQLSYEPTEIGKRRIRMEIDEKTKNFIEEYILGLSIIDSAMGSGHFLVNAAYRIANEIVEIVSANNWKTDLDFPADIAYWKRRVVENCIYGIDINELAVVLARLSLWLISASNDKALSFIDHHLKVGDSIIGTDRTKVERIKDKEKMSMFDVSYERFMEPILSRYEKMKQIGSKTKEDVELQKEEYQKIKIELELVKCKYDFYLASQYQGGIDNDMKYSEIMNARDFSMFESVETRALLSFANENKFFHWELEFPEVFANGGFDAIIGNPPYVDVKEEKYRAVIKETIKCRNLYAYMAESGIKYLDIDGYYGSILPSASVCTPRMIDFQNIIAKNSRKLFISTYDDRPGKIFVNLESMRVAIILMSKKGSADKNPEIYVTKYNRFLSSERKQLFKNLKYIQIDSNQIKGGYIPKFGDELERPIHEKIFSNINTIGDYISKEGNKLFYGVGVRYWIKVLTRPSMEVDDYNLRLSSGEKTIVIDKRVNLDMINCILNSSLFFWFYQNYSDCRNFSLNAVKLFPLKEDVDLATQKELIRLSELLMKDYFKNSIVKETVYKTTGSLKYREFKIRNSKVLLDEIDDILGKVYGLNSLEIEFIKNYEIQFRMGLKSQEDGGNEL